MALPTPTSFVPSNQVRAAGSGNRLYLSANFRLFFRSRNTHNNLLREVYLIVAVNRAVSMLVQSYSNRTFSV